MSQTNNTIRRVISIIFAILVAVAGSLPFILFRDRLTELGGAGYWGLLIACFLTNSTVFLPASGIAFTVSASTVLNPMLCIILGALGTSLGELIGYFCGKLGVGKVTEAQQNNRINDFVNKRVFWAIFLFGFLPLPMFDIVGIMCGFVRYPLPKFFIACFLGKLLKMTLFVCGTKYLLLLGEQVYGNTGYSFLPRSFG